MSGNLKNKHEHPSESNLSGVMNKMRSTLQALEVAFERAMDLSDPMDRTNHEIGTTLENDEQDRNHMA